MIITIAGSTGRTGLHVVQQALDAGHEVRALARTPAKMAIEHPHLTTYQADVLKDDLEPAIAHTDAVIIALGGAQRHDPTTRSEGTRRIIDTMRQNHITRVVAMSSVGAGESMRQLSEQGQQFVRNVIQTAVDDHERQEALLQHSDLDWTIVRPGGLSDGPRAAYDADPTASIMVRQIRRASVADFMLRALHNEDTIGHTYALTDAL